MLSFEFLTQNVEYLSKAVHETEPPPLDVEIPKARVKRARRLEPAFPCTPHVFERFNNNKNSMMCDWRDSEGSHTRSITCTQVAREDEFNFNAKRMRIALELEKWYKDNVVE